jgi:lipoprotein signal peptidase
MNNNTLFGPLGKQYCILWYLLSVFALVIVILNVFGIFFMLYRNEKNSFIYMMNVYVICIGAIGYLQARMLYHMCNAVL